MPIDVTVRLSPGWWMDRLFRKLRDRARHQRLTLLANIYGGDPPLPIGADNVREMYAAFQRLARSNYASLAVGAVSERMTPTGFRTAADGDPTGDKLAAQIWKRAGMPVTAADVHEAKQYAAQAAIEAAAALKADADAAKYNAQAQQDAAAAADDARAAHADADAANDSATAAERDAASAHAAADEADQQAAAARASADRAEADAKRAEAAGAGRSGREGRPRRGRQC